MNERHEAAVREIGEWWRFGLITTCELIEKAARMGPEAKALAETIVADYEAAHPRPTRPKLVAENGRLL